MRAKAVIFVGLVLCAVSAPVFAHHSFAASYFEDQKSTIHGTLVEFQYKNPHSLVTMDVTDPKTLEPVRWMIEWASATRLAREGVIADTLRPGDQVTILGHPSRNLEDHKLHMWGIARPSDGWRWGHAID